jgi:hypothetical protein
MRGRGAAVSGLEKKGKRKETPSFKTRSEAKEWITNCSGQVVSFQHFHILKMRNELQIILVVILLYIIFILKNYTANFKTGKYAHGIRIPGVKKFVSDPDTVSVKIATQKQVFIIKELLHVRYL